MTHLFWNCRGLGSDTVVRALHGLIREHRPSMIFLSETKMQDHRIDKVRRRMGYTNGFNVAPVGRAGGLSLWWNDSIWVEVIDSSKHFIDARCKSEELPSEFRFTGVYGTSYRAEKEVFWRDMINKFNSDIGPWLCGGDFNEILWDHEKNGGAAVRYSRPRYLEEFMGKTGLMDVGFKGPKYTWRGMRNGQMVEARLDRALLNDKWQFFWPNTAVVIGACVGSDHCPVVVKENIQMQKRGKRMFRFEAFWAKDLECKEIVKQVWERNRFGNPVQRWNEKIEVCRNKLSRWSKEKFNRNESILKEKVEVLGILQCDWGKYEEEIKVLSKEVDSLRRQEESYWLQRSRVQWLREGDANTKFFHQYTIHRRRRNKVVKLKNGNGEWVDNPGLIRGLVDTHFVDLFTSTGQRDWGEILQCISPKVTDTMNDSLIGPVSVEEVKAAALNMGGSKAPGPDGFSGNFYHTHWNTLAADINELIGVLIQGQVSPGGLNATHVVLIPKVLNPEMVSQFRPISLCNYSYKVLSKVLANRLKPLLPILISPNQNAFVSGRQIQDNIGIAQELFHFLKTRKAKSRWEVGIKLDMHKAYDRVEWDFLMAVMERMGFDSLWRKLILGCISSVNFAILLNGQPGRKFAHSHGLRQGDPLSPYLFLLVSEVLSLCIQSNCDQGNLRGIQMSSPGPTISHIFFADDTLIFLKADEANCRLLSKVIDEYCFASGQKVNKSKSSVFFGSNVPVRLANLLTATLGMDRVDDPGSYLGVPAIWGRSKKSGLAYIKGRLLEKLQGWKKNFLSHAGRETLIKAVAQAIPAYPMNLFKFPSSFCKEIDALISNFWWGQLEGEHRIHWISKEKLGWAKDKGGLGFRSFEFFNDALLAKQCWRLIEDPDSLWASMLKARYFPNCSFLEAKKGGRASWVWSSLLSGRELLINGAHWQVMNGKDIKVWGDRWVPSIPAGKPLPLGSQRVSRNLRVDALIDSGLGVWDLAFLEPFIARPELDAILEVCLGDPSLPDRLVWPHDKRGVFSVKSGYHWAVNRSLLPIQSLGSLIPPAFWNLVWSIEAPPKIKIFFWKTLHGALAIMDNLFRRRSSSSPVCPLCKSNAETMDHLFLFCPWVESIWFGGRFTLRVNRPEVSSWVQWLLHLFESVRGSKEVRLPLFSYIAYSCWHIWKSRCDFLFNNLHVSPLRVISATSLSVSEFQSAQVCSALGSNLIPPGSMVRARWTPPNAGYVKINVDASWDRVGRVGFTGVVARDDRGRFLAAVRGEGRASSASMMEALAILHGCRLGKNQGWDLIVIESDSLDSISCLRDLAKKGNWEAYPIITKCCGFGREFRDCRWSWVPRLANSAADRLASRRCSEACDRVWVSRPPSSLVHVLCNDGLPCPP